MNRRTIATLLLTTALPLAAHAAAADSPYTGWCEHSATAERIPAAERERHVAECIEALEEADRNPDKGKKRDNDEG